MKKKILLITSIIVIAILAVTIVLSITKEEKEIVSIKSMKQLEKIYEGNEYNYSEAGEILKDIITMPFGLLFCGLHGSGSYYTGDVVYSSSIGPTSVNVDSALSVAKAESATNTTSSSTGSSKDYSTTNVQVENVDEADITKTDGDYIYSLSGNDVIITDARNPEELKIASKIELSNSSPEDLILYNNYLVVIEVTGDSYYYNYNSNTLVEVYNLEDKESPKKVKSYELYEPYYTSRCIDGKLYVISSGDLREENDEIVISYKEDNKTIEMDLNNISYLKDVETDTQTLISMLDLNNLTNSVKINSYLIDIENAYVSENNIYLADQNYEDYDYSKWYILKRLYSIKGIFGMVADDDYDDYEEKTSIYKFNLQEDGSIKYIGKTKTDGEIINQFSLDEYNDNLRVALETDKGSRVVIFDKDLKEIGKTDYLAKGENMYSSRFIGDRAYLVTYQTVDPLFVINLADPENPVVEGELKIPGYSTYLHPYDENHIIGIGMQTEETVNRNYSTGRVTSTTAKITGMKMALFDVTDVNNPKQISSVVIGDRRTTSSILTNHKALLFSKEKELLAIPVNNYEEDFTVDDDGENYQSAISSYTSKSNYISEGYLVYSINLTEGIKEKGLIVHEEETQNTKYYYRTTSKLLRGLYIDDNLYTISEEKIKVNRLDNLELVSQLEISEDKEENELVEVIYD